ncbi:PilW family protein [Haliangium sp.]|uniref:PilW family protein n=1 Tax=Haliangium sp. TaxID=2663208 RepID=UPI003D138BAD
MKARLGTIVPGSGARRRRGERGLTLIELMIAMVVAAILVGFVFDIQSRMSTAYRSQTDIGSLQQGVRAAAEMMARDARAAGFAMPRGAKLSNKFTSVNAPGTPGLIELSTAAPLPPLAFTPMLRPIKSIDNAWELTSPGSFPADHWQPDSVHFFYGIDFDTHGVISQDPGATITFITLEDDGNYGDGNAWQTGDLVVISNSLPPAPNPLDPGGTDQDLPTISRYDACIVQITGPFNSTGPPTLQFADTTIFNSADNNHCAGIAVQGAHVYLLIARAYRIDTTRPRIAALQRSETGGLLDDWQDIAIGFVDLQISEHHAYTTDPDGDLDGILIGGTPNARMDWYSNLAPPPQPAPAADPMVHLDTLTELGISLVARTNKPVEGVTTATIPVLATGVLDHNPVGNAGGPKANDPSHPEFDGDHVYRQISLIVDTRNVGVSR